MDDVYCQNKPECGVIVYYIKATITLDMKINLRIKELFSSSLDKENSKNPRVYTPRAKDLLQTEATPKLQITPKHTRTRSYLSPRALNAYIENNRLKTETESEMLVDNRPTNNELAVKPRLIINIFDKGNNEKNGAESKPKKRRVISKVPLVLKPKQSLIDEFKVIRLIGKGRFGRVVSAQHGPTGFVCALKEIDLSEMCQKLCERLISEVKIQSYIECENCLPLYSFFVNEKKLYLILELGDTCLYDLLKKKKFLSESLTALYIRQTINALLELHSKGIIHRDLKPENIILVNGTVKLADFGWATYSPIEKRLTYCGTLDYISPEIIVGEEYSHHTDIWSVGVLCYELTVGSPPFQSNRGREDTERKIVRSGLKFPNHLSPLVKDFITKLLTKNPDDRMDLVEALDHPWLKLYQNYDY